jgi:hypothetical protein
LNFVSTHYGPISAHPLVPKVKQIPVDQLEFSTLLPVWEAFQRRRYDDFIAGIVIGSSMEGEQQSGEDDVILTSESLQAVLSATLQVENMVSPADNSSRESELRKSILEIHNNSSLSPREKAQKMQVISLGIFLFIHLGINVR